MGIVVALLTIGFALSVRRVWPYAVLWIVGLAAAAATIGIALATSDLPAPASFGFELYAGAWLRAFAIEMLIIAAWYLLGAAIAASFRRIRRAS